MLPDNVYKILREYESFYCSKGVRRVNAIKWANKEIRSIEPLIRLKTAEGELLQKIGWTNYIGLGVYSGIVFHITSNVELSNKAEIRKLLDELIEVMLSVIEYTDIGYYVSYKSPIQKSEEIRYARTDDMGNIFVYPDDVEQLINDLEEVLTA